MELPKLGYVQTREGLINLSKNEEGEYRLSIVLPREIIGLIEKDIEESEKVRNLTEEAKECVLQSRIVKTSIINMVAQYLSALGSLQNVVHEVFILQSSILNVSVDEIHQREKELIDSQMVAAKEKH